jgi:hypothetical protein
VPTVPAGEPLTLWFAWVAKNRGLDEAWIQGMTLELTIDGISYTNLDAYYQPPGDFHWPTSNPLLEELWAIPWVFPLDPLAPGESFTYTLTMTAHHRLLDGASPSDGPGNSPYFWGPGFFSSTTCTVTAN